MGTLRKRKLQNELDNPIFQIIQTLFEKYSDAYHLEIDSTLSLENCSLMLNALLYSHKVHSAKDKLEIIDALDEIKILQENIALNSGKISKSEIETASKNLGKKAQSSFEE